MGLSADVIWHQTNFHGLKAILCSRRFLCSYSLETIKWKSSNIQRAFPMISFCNIPLSDLYEYLKDNKKTIFTGKYGRYTIGMTHEWSRKNRLAPVWYHDFHSSPLLKIMPYHENLSSKEWSNFEIAIWNILSRIKNYEGSLEKYQFKKYRFYDEKEFRFVPDFSELTSSGVSPILDHKGYDLYKSRHHNTALINNFYLPFEKDDLSYVLYSHSSQRNKIVDLLKDYDNVTIMTYKQVLKDVIGIGHYSSW